mgnify:CR=1 FL=1
MSRFGSAPKLPPKAPRRPLKTEILWGCEKGGSPRFPSDCETISTRRRSPNPRPLDAFRDAVKNAAERIWVVDEYFLVSDKGVSSDGRILTILDWLHDDLVASDIRILTKQHDEVTEDELELFKDQAEMINLKRSRQPVKCSIQINTRLKQKFDYIHDRFAIVDDELWHFGATVGGFHSSVNAASRGWDAEELGAIKFFEMVWDKCKK